MRRPELSLTEADAHARALRAYLNRIGLDISNYQACDAVAQQHGFRDWISMRTDIPDGTSLFVIEACTEKQEATNSCISSTVLVEATTPELALYHAKKLARQNLHLFDAADKLKIDCVRSVSGVPEEGLIVNVMNYTDDLSTSTAVLPVVAPDAQTEYPCDEVVELTPFIADDVFELPVLDTRPSNRVNTVLAALNKHDGDKAKAAKELGISSRTIFRVLESIRPRVD